MSTLADIDAEIDPKAQPDSNLQHIRHMFEGYRARTSGDDCNPYSPGSARAYSWMKGWTLADKDFETASPV